MSAVGTFLGSRDAAGFEAGFAPLSGLLLVPEDTQRLWIIDVGLEAARSSPGPSAVEGGHSGFRSA